MGVLARAVVTPRGPVRPGRKQEIAPCCSCGSDADEAVPLAITSGLQDTLQTPDGSLNRGLVVVELDAIEALLVGLQFPVGIGDDRVRQDCCWIPERDPRLGVPVEEATRIRAGLVATQRADQQRGQRLVEVGILKPARQLKDHPEAVATLSVLVGRGRVDQRRLLHQGVS